MKHTHHNNPETTFHVELTTHQQIWDAMDRKPFYELVLGTKATEDARWNYTPIDSVIANRLIAEAQDDRHIITGTINHNNGIIFLYIKNK